MVAHTRIENQIGRLPAIRHMYQPAGIIATAITISQG
jgi:hypothetical protein